MNNPIKATALGLQHVLAMYAGAVIVPLIVGGCTWPNIYTIDLSCFH